MVVVKTIRCVPLKENCKNNTFIERNGYMRLFCKHLDNPLLFVRNIMGDEINMFNGARSIWKCPDCGKLIFRPYVFIQGEVSDGHHTFNELYHHRAILFSVICNKYKDLSWKSKRHSDGTMYDDMFIVGIETPEGQATYHYDIKPYWDMFDVKELEYAPEWDGHSPSEAIERIGKLKHG